MIYGAHLTFLASEDSRPIGQGGPATIRIDLSPSGKKVAHVLTADKTSLRTALRMRRKALHKTVEHTRFSQLACEHLAEIFEEKPGQIIAVYWPIGSELDIRAVLTEAPLGRFCLPIIGLETRILSFGSFTDMTDLTTGPLGVLQPAAQAELITPDIVCVPLVGFDARGGRLGQGGGYYDATIASLRIDQPNIQAIGVGFACQEVPNIPTQPHDATLDAIATEDGIRYL